MTYNTKSTLIEELMEAPSENNARISPQRTA